MPDAQVTIKNTGTSATQSVSSDDQGRYTVPDLGIGTYDLTVTKSGFRTAVRSGVVLTVGSAPVVDFSLVVGQTSQSVEVSAAVSQVETTNAAISSLVNQTQMRELPLNGRDWEQLILLAPGVLSYYPSGGSGALTSVANAYSISGTRPEGYSNILDGEDMLNWWQRNAGGDVTGTTLGIDAIAEFQTLTGTYSAQYAGNGGAIVGVTKSGTNEFHGSVYEFFRNSDLDAHGFFRCRFSASVPQKSVRRHLWRPNQKEQDLFRLFVVSGGLTGEIKFACHQINDAGEVAERAIPARLGLRRLYQTVDALEDAIVDA